MIILLNTTKLVMPVLLLLFAVILLLSKRNLMDSFVKGAVEGAECCYKLLPTLLLIMCGVGAVFSSGAVDILCAFFRPVLRFFGVPSQMLPAIILRPFSGSGVTAVADKLFKELGADDRVSKIACLLMGSTDTIIYTLCLYFSAAGIKKTRYAIPASFVVFLFSIWICVFVGNLLF